MTDVGKYPDQYLKLKKQGHFFKYKFIGSLILYY